MLRTIILCAFLPLALAAPRPFTGTAEPTPIQAPAQPYRSNPERAEAVRQAFRDAWRGYFTVFGADEIRPLSSKGGKSRNGWGATPIDALTTAILMGEKDIVNQVLEFIPTIDFSVNNNPRDSVSLFETTIRYLGGLTSAYDLLSIGGPGAHLVDPSTDLDTLLKQAKKLADIMSYSFTRSETGIPHNELYFPTADGKITEYSTDDGDENGLATLGTLILEWTRLSDQSGNRTYFDLASRAQSYLMDPKPNSEEPFPGLISSSISISTGELTGGYVSWSGGADSFYEYLIKMFVYDPKRFELYRDRWILAADSSIKNLAYTAQPSGATFLTEYDVNSESKILKTGHLTCFDGGNFILGGIVLDRQDYIDFGLDLVHGCWKTYNASATGIGPERWSFDPEKVPTDQSESFDIGGFYSSPSDPSWARGYFLRPEVLESIYYAYRATGDPKYQDWAWKAFQSIEQYCKTPLGYVGLVDTNNATSPLRMDMQESYFFAETLKYLYIIQADEAEWQIGGPATADKNQKWVMNTEAHPMKVFNGSLY